MHTFFDAGIVVVSAVVALLLWDLGWRTEDHLTRLIAVAIGITAVFELVHVLPALEVSRDAVDAARLAGLLRPVTWPPAAYHAADRSLRGVRAAQTRARTHNPRWQSAC